MNDKLIEQSRYDGRAATVIDNSESFTFNKLPSYYLPPFNSYYNLLTTIPSGSRVLEIGAGMGENTEFLLNNGFKVVSTDISPNSVKVMKNRFAQFKNFQSEVADMEELQFENDSFDAICSAGSLSYGENRIVRNNIYRILKTNGVFIAIDSLNNNLIYRFNRYLHYLSGNRSKSTLHRMPNIDLISKYIAKFGKGEVAYFGSITYLFPLLRKFKTEESITSLSNSIDKKLNIKKSAFKFTMKVTKL